MVLQDLTSESIRKARDLKEAKNDPNVKIVIDNDESMGTSDEKIKPK